MRTKIWIEQHNWIKRLLWIVIGVIISLVCEKSYNYFLPEEPIIIKEVSDSIKVIHSYDFSIGVDSIVQTQLEKKLKNIELANSYEIQVGKQLRKNKGDQSNLVKLKTDFKNAKGYSIGNAMTFFSVKYPNYNNGFLDFDIHFINSELTKDIYCLSLKIDEIKNGKHSIYLDENYDIKDLGNKIRIVNSLPKGLYEISIGFFLKKDLNSEYPCFYKVSQRVQKQ